MSSTNEFANALILALARARGLRGFTATEATFVGKQAALAALKAQAFALALKGHAAIDVTPEWEISFLPLPSEPAPACVREESDTGCWPGGLTHEGGTVAREAEAAYRRGYAHGANEVIEAVASGELSLSGLRDWLHCDVADWRYNPADLCGSDRAKLVPPPEVPGRRNSVTTRTRHDVTEYTVADESCVEYAAAL